MRREASGPKPRVAAAAREMSAEGLMKGTSGGISMRSATGFLITPDGVDHRALSARDIVAMTLDGGHRGRRSPSSAWRLHRDIYRAQPDAGAIVHTRSPYATAVSTLRISVPAFHHMVAMTGGATLPCADFATSETESLSKAVLAAIDGRTACLLANRGMVCHAATLERALRLAGEIEMLCQQYIAARSIGEPIVLDDSEIERELARLSTRD